MMKKVVVLGCSGSGKSTFAVQLHNATGLPLYHLDNIWWKPDRTHITREEFDKKLDDLVCGDSWIIDGDYSRTYEKRIAACDTIIFLDYGEDVCMNGINERVGKERSDIPWTENELDPELVKLVRDYETENKPALLELFKKYSDRDVITLHTREEADNLLIEAGLIRGQKALIINCSPVRTGATAEIVNIIDKEISSRYSTKCICIADYSFEFCKGCRMCHNTAKCVMNDDIVKIMDEFDDADVIVSVSPSYWADIPGQYKAFIDRCTPWCDTHEPHASIREGKKGYSIALRTGPGMHECDRIIQSIEHFYGHLHIECMGHLGLTSIEYKENVEPRKQDIIDFCEII